MRSFLIYNLARLGLLVGCILIIWTIWGRSLWGAVAGIIISALLSFVVLAPLREKSANELIDSAQKRREAEAEIGRLESELKQKLLDIHT